MQIGDAVMNDHNRKKPTKAENRAFKSQAYKVRSKHGIESDAYHTFFLEHKGTFFFSEPAVPPRAKLDAATPDEQHLHAAPAPTTALSAPPASPPVAPSAEALRSKKYRATKKAKTCVDATATRTPSATSSDSEHDSMDDEASSPPPSAKPRPSDRKRRRDVAAMATTISQTLQPFSPSSQKRLVSKVFSHKKMQQTAVPSPLIKGSQQKRDASALMLENAKQFLDNTAAARSTLAKNVRATIITTLAHPQLARQHRVTAAAGVLGGSRAAWRAAAAANSVNADQPMAMFVPVPVIYKNKTPAEVVELIFNFWTSETRLRGGKAGAAIRAPKGKRTCGTGSTHPKHYLEESQTQLFIRCVCRCRCRCGCVCGVVMLVLLAGSRSSCSLKQGRKCSKTCAMLCTGQTSRSWSRSAHSRPTSHGSSAAQGTAGNITAIIDVA
jgi:hypothetical protein